MRVYNKRKLLRRYATFRTKNVVAGNDINVRVRKPISKEDKIAWIGTTLLLFGPYLLSYQIGFILNAIGIMLLTPQVYKARQWNLVFLNVVSSTGYWLQIFNII